MPETIKNWPATVRELGQMAEREGKTLSALLTELEAELGPVPVPPSGYSLAPGCSDHWVGPETYSRGWIITPAWDAATGRHSLELWAATDPDKTYHHLSESEAVDLAADLIAAAKTIHVATEGGAK